MESFKKRVAVIGTGYVGLVTGTCLAEIGHRVICVDRKPEKVKLLRKGRSPIYEPGIEPLIRKNIRAKRLFFTTNLPEAIQASDIVFLAVQTPPDEDGKADLSHVLKAAEQIARAADHPLFVIQKSTVPVGTGARIQKILPEHTVVSNPEFLREGTAVKDFLKPDRIVIGTGNELAIRTMRELYRRFRGKLFITDLHSAELVKYASNSFLAMKISYANAIAELCERNGANIEEVTRGMGLDPRIGPAFLRAGLGYGGSCFPKDVSALAAIAEETGHAFDLLRTVEAINARARAQFAKKIIHTLGSGQGKTIAVWGLAFKPLTDDIREAPSVSIIHTLRKAGFQIRAFDPVAHETAKKVLGDMVTYARDPYDALRGADALAIVTEWDAFRKADLKKVKELLPSMRIFDGRNVFDPTEMKRLGFLYSSVGRAARA